ncbi:MAG: hypothetical protein Q9163_001236, partial [Psora crenata]
KQVLSPTHLLAAIFRACNDSLNGRTKTRNVHSETVFCLGATNNIATTLSTFGISAGTADLIVVKISWAFGRVVEGTLVEFDGEGVGRAGDVERVKEIYKLGGSGGNVGSKGRRSRKDGSWEGEGGSWGGLKGMSQGIVGAEKEERREQERKEVEMQVLGLMALRGAV